MGDLPATGALAALAVERDATMASFDTDFSLFAGVRLQVPAPVAALRPITDRSQDGTGIGRIATWPSVA